MLNMHAVDGEVNGQPVDDPTHDRTPFFKFYVDDWIAGTQGLSCEQKGFYIDLLCLMWARKGGLPTDTNELAKLMRMDRRRVNRLVKELSDLGKLKIVKGALVNGRMFQAIMDSQSQSRVAKLPRKVGKKSEQSLGEVGAKSGQKQKPNADKSKTYAEPPEPKPEPEPDNNSERPKGLLSSADDAPEQKRKRAKPKIEVDTLAAFNAWNAIALRLGLKQAAKLTPGRRKRIEARIREHGGMEAWTKALAKVEASSFLRGGGQHGWTAHLDFLLQSSSFGKLIDGQYDDRAPVAQNVAAVPMSAKRASALAAQQEMFG